MNLWQLISREILHRKLNFLLGVLAVMVASACLVGAQTLMTRDRIVTGQILSAKEEQVQAAVAAKQQEVEKAGAELEDAIRKHMKGLGFNVLILPEDQDLGELHLNGTLSATMPEEYVERLANSDIITVNHLLPSVMKRVEWTEKEMDVILYGTRGEVPIMHRDLKKPLLDAVAPGNMVVGHTVHTKLGLAEGDTVEFMGREFTVSKLHPERGSTDDVTIWIDLKLAQELLSMQNLVHAILALECECAGDRIAQIRAEISGILPGTQVIERYSQALARAEARAKAKEVAEAALIREQKAGEETLAREREGRYQIEAQHASLAGVIVPLVLIGAAGLIGFLAYANARQRREEIGILRAIGVRTSQIVLLFLGKAVILGVLGGIIGVGLGVWVGVHAGETSAAAPQFEQLVSASPGLWMTLASTPLLAVALAAIASWTAAIFAARQDAAIVLQGE